MNQMSPVVSTVCAHAVLRLARAVASSSSGYAIVFAVIAVQEAHLPGANTILGTTYLTIGLSVFAHGITSVPLARRYAHWYRSNPPGRREMESVQAPGHRPRGALYSNPQP